MNQKIDSTHEELSTNKEEFTRGFFISLILLTIVILIGVMISENQCEWFINHEFRAYANISPLFTLSPSMYPSYQTITNGLSAFSDKAPMLPDFTLKIGLLASIIVIYIIISTVFFFNWRKRRIEKKPVSTTKPLSFSSVSYALCSIFIISIAVTTIASSIGRYIMGRGIEQAQAIQSDKDEMISEMNLIALDMYQYKLVPKELGGGEGKYTGYVIPPERAKTKHGVYTVIISEQKVEIHGQSLQFPSGTIQTSVNEQGQTGNWQFEGSFY
jgi:hypothetical protein